MNRASSALTCCWKVAIGMRIDDGFLFGVVLLQLAQQPMAGIAQLFGVGSVNDQIGQGAHGAPQFAVLAHHYKDRHDHAGLADRREQDGLLQVDVSAQRFQCRA